MFVWMCLVVWMGGGRHTARLADTKQVRLDAITFFVEHFAGIDLEPLRGMRKLEEDVVTDLFKALQVLYSHLLLYLFLNSVSEI
jgi:hypothetical protein